MSPGSVGRHSNSSWVRALDAGTLNCANSAKAPKCSGASSAVIDFTGTFIAAGLAVAIIPGGLPGGSMRPDLTTIPLHGVAPSHVILATRAADRSRLVAAFRRSAQDCLTGPGAETTA